MSQNEPQYLVDVPGGMEAAEALASKLLSDHSGDKGSLLILYIAAQEVCARVGADLLLGNDAAPEKLRDCRNVWGIRIRGVHQEMEKHAHEYEFGLYNWKREQTQRP